MAAHNVALPQHQYVWVWSPAVRRDDTSGWEPAVWFGTASHTGRMLGCHLLLEDGATVWDVPLHLVRGEADDTARPIAPADAQGWDAYGMHHEWAHFSLLTEVDVTVLDRTHQHAEIRGVHTGLVLDYVNDAYSAAPEQHKAHQLILRDDGAFALVPQDRVVVREASFTVDGPVRPVRRQTQRWHCE